MPESILIHGGTVIDGTGADARPGEAVLLRDGKIAALGTRAEEQAAALPEVTRIDATGRTVMPGLIDAHTHLSFGEPTGNDELFFHRTEAYSSMLSAHNAQKVLRAGVTGVLDADCLWNIGVELRDAIEAGFVEGPRMRAGGNALMTMLGGTAGRLIRDEGTTGYATVVHDVDGIAREVRRQIKYGVDWIKVMVTGLIPSVKGPEVKVWHKREIQAVVDAAHELNTPVVGHCRNSISTKESAEAGMDLIYHSSYMDDEALEAVIENGSALCPTFTLLGNLVDYGERVGTAPELLDIFRAELDVTGRHDRQGAPRRRAGHHRVGDRLRDHPVRGVARPRAGDVRAVRRLLADGGHPGGDVPGRLGDEDGGPGRRAAGGAPGRRHRRRRRPAGRHHGPRPARARSSR